MIRGSEGRAPARAPWIALLAAAALAGCGDTQGPFDTRPGADDENEPAGYTTPAELIDAFAKAMSERNLDDYIALLEPWTGTRAAAGFRWYPQVWDLDDLPWLDGEEYWDREEEIGMISHMFDDTFVSQETGQSIDSITAEIDIESVESLAGGEIRVKTIAIVQVLWAEDSGLRCEVRLEFLLVRGEDGFVTIRSVREYSLLARDDRSVDNSTFSVIKALYRAEAP